MRWVSASALHKAMQTHVAFQDATVKLLLTCLPEPPPGVQDAAKARARQRCDKLLRAVDWRSCKCCIRVSQECGVTSPSLEKGAAHREGRRVINGAALAHHHRPTNSEAPCV